MFNGVKMSNDGLPFVNDYLERKNFAKIGVWEDANSLSDFELEYLQFIGNEFNKLYNEARKKQEAKNKRRGKGKKGLRRGR